MSPRLLALLDWCFFGPISTRAGRLGATVRTLRYPYAVLRDLGSGEITLRATGLVYTTLLALIPFVAFSFGILKLFGARHDLEPILLQLFQPLGARGAREMSSGIMQFAARVSGVIGSVGFALFTWTLIGTLKRVEDSLNFLWRVDQPRGLARRLTEYLTLLIVGPLLLVAFFGLVHATFASTPLQQAVRLPVLQRFSVAVLGLVPYVMVTLMFAALYRFVPNTRVRWRAALIGAVVAGVSWAFAGRLFTRLVVYSARLNLVYAGSAVIVAALLWTYAGWLILLAGAQLSFYIQNPSYLRAGLTEIRLSSRELEQLALKLMYFVGRAHLGRGSRCTVDELAALLGLPGIPVAHMAAALERAGLLVSVHGQLLPARDIGQIRAIDILEIARHQRSGHAGLRSAPVPSIERLLNSLDTARQECCGEVTLRELVEDAHTPAFVLPRDAAREPSRT